MRIRAKRRFHAEVGTGALNTNTCDIAVLVATNHEAQAVASALHERKIRASVAV